MDTSSVLDLITQATPNDGLDVRLLASSIVEGSTLSPADLVEVSFDGYEAVRSSEWRNLAEPGEDGASIVSPVLRIDRLTSGLKATVRAYAVTADTEDGRRLVCAANLGVPMSLEDAGDAVRFRLSITCFVVQPLDEGGQVKEVVTSCFEQLSSRS